MKILFVGDIVGKGGRNACCELVPALRESLGCSLVIANGENIAGGGGFTAKCVAQLCRAGVDVVTGGDHMWDQRSFSDEINDLPQVLRPANVSDRQPGRGWHVYLTDGGAEVGVVSLLGRTFMNSQADCPFAAAERIVDTLRERTPIIIIDIHAEATSEKIAMGRYLDGKVSAVLGTHTHVVTADEQIFPGGTAYQTDVGMVGARESILGRDIAPVLQRFSTGMPARFTVTEGGIRLHGTIVDVDVTSGHAVSIERVVRDLGAR